MKRRDALKSITLSSGAIISSASILGLLQSCVADKATWKPKLFNELEGKILTVLCDLILPKSDSPSASMVNVPQFIDKMMADVYEVERGEKFRKGMNLFNDVFKKEIGDDFPDASSTEQAAALSGYFDIPVAEVDAVKDLVRGKTSDKSSDKYYIYSFLSNLRNMTINSYFTSEEVGEKVLAYDPVPGSYDGCIALADIGKSWSL